MNKALIATLPLIALAACTDERPGHPGLMRECRAGAAQRFVGAPWRPDLERRAQRATGARTVRVLRPGQAATMDYRQDRLNVRVDARNFITGLDCG